jgi:PPK2 family polyphosphate:nucleotide phosphotransferase
VAKKSQKPSWSQLLRPDPGAVELAAVAPRSTPGFDGKKTDGHDALGELTGRMDDVQEALYADGRSGGSRRLLLVLQGMDTAGKGGTMRHCVGLMDPQGVSITAFKAPTAEERNHDFLWRIERALPSAGQVGVFDRSHYEDVLIQRVRGMAPAEEIDRRYDAINEFEASVVASGCPVVKVMLHISRDEQKQRLLERLENPHKYWKYNPSDVDERELWDDYQRAYEIALERCNTESAPWHIVPADRKWYRNLAVANLLVEQLEAMDLGWPPADFDVDVETKRVKAS